MIKMKLEIPEETKKALQLTGLDSLVKELAIAVRTRMIASTPRDSGRAARSWSGIKRESGGMSFNGGTGDGPVQRRIAGYSFGNSAEYAHILETGSTPGKRPWPSVGPRTTLEGGRIFSSQAPGGMIESGQIEDMIRQVLPQLIAKHLGK